MDNIYNPNVSNGIFYRYRNLISKLLEEEREVCFITRHEVAAIYPVNLSIKYISFIKYPPYPELYLPNLIGIKRLINPSSSVITLLEYSYFNLCHLPDNINLILGYHTRLDLYTEDTFFRKIAYNITCKLVSRLKPKLILLSGYSSKPICERVFINSPEYIIWYDMVSSFLDYPILNKTYDVNKPLNFIYCGRIDQQQKNVEMLFSIIDKYNKKYGKAFLTLIGHGPDFTKYKSLNMPNVIFRGMIANNLLYQEYSKYENPLFIFPSKKETLGKSPIEASLCGLPVFTNISDETPYIYKDGINGYTFTTTDECCRKIKSFIDLSASDKWKIILAGKELKTLFCPNETYSEIIPYL